MRYLWLSVSHAYQRHTLLVRRGKPVVSDMVYAPRSDCLVVRHEDNDKAFYRGIIVLDLAAGGRMVYNVDDLGCAPQLPAAYADRGQDVVTISCVLCCAGRTTTSWRARCWTEALAPSW